MKPELERRDGKGGSIEVSDARDAEEPLRLLAGFEPGRSSPSIPTSGCSSVFAPRREADVSSSLSLTRLNCSYRAPTWVRYDVNSVLSMRVMFVRVTGGMSLAVGGLWVLDAGAVACG
jgi:hypothetical protein